MDDERALLERIEKRVAETKARGEEPVRADDNPEVLKKRLNLPAQTGAAFDYYAGKGKRGRRHDAIEQVDRGRPRSGAAEGRVRGGQEGRGPEPRKPPAARPRQGRQRPRTQRPGGAQGVGPAGGGKGQKGATAKDQARREDVTKKERLIA